MSGAATSVWVSPGATMFSCLCEDCLETARTGGLTLFDAIQGASVRGTIGAETTVAFAQCRAGHEIVVRRVERPPGLHKQDERQLQIA